MNFKDMPTAALREISGRLALTNRSPVTGPPGGYKAYLVGGCVRDLLLGAEPHDFDIATDAPPETAAEIFSDFTLVTAGLKHGTVTVMFPIAETEVKQPFEITTFRVDGGYSDGRRPDSVTFTASVEDDLARRDFTINALAVRINENFFKDAETAEIIDPYGGREDLRNKTIRAVGDPRKRFSEDALRILRGLRFSTVLGFEIEPETSAAMLSLRENIRALSGERIASEILRMFAVKNGSVLPPILREYREVFAQVFPQLRECFDFKQHSRYHRYDVYEHTVRTVQFCAAGFTDIEKLPLLRLAMLLHDTGKPRTYTLRDGEGHFYGHPQVSANIAKAAAYRLKLSGADTRLLTELVRLHDITLTDTEDQSPSDIFIKKKLAAYGIEFLQLLTAVHIADSKGKQPEGFADKRVPVYEYVYTRAKEIYDGGACVTRKQLAVNGADLSERGVVGADIGGALDKLLYAVIEEKTDNNKESLLKYLNLF